MSEDDIGYLLTMFHTFDLILRSSVISAVFRPTRLLFCENGSRVLRARELTELQRNPC